MTDLTKINTPFGELDRETKGALLLAAQEGAEIEYSTVAEDYWLAVQRPAWCSEIVYRVKSVPLTPDTIDWSQVADGWDWMARDEDGTVYLYRSKPAHSLSLWAGEDDALVTQSSYCRGTCDWKDSLIRRPGK